MEYVKNEITEWVWMGTKTPGLGSDRPELQGDTWLPQVFPAWLWYGSQILPLQRGLKTLHGK